MSDGDRDSKGRFVSGNIGGPGRPRGARAKLGEAFLTALCDDFHEHGEDAIREVREKRPADYLKVCASLMPKELTVKVDPLEELTPEQLDAHIRRLAGKISLETGIGEGLGVEGAPIEPEPPGGVPPVH